MVGIVIPPRVILLADPSIKKQRVIVLSVGGALLAVLAFLVIASLRSSPDTTAVTAASRPSAAPVIQVTPVASGKLQPPPIIFGPDSLPLELEDADKKKKPPPAASAVAPVARPAGAGRDYGI